MCATSHHAQPRTTIHACLFCRERIVAALIALTLALAPGPVCTAQPIAGPVLPVPHAPTHRPEGTSASGDLPLNPGAITVEPVATDEQIRARLVSILEATGWFTRTDVQVREGVVFLDGIAASADDRKWAGDLARSTQGVVAAVNRMGVAQPSIWEFGGALGGLRGLGRDLLSALPMIAFAVIVLLIAAALGWFASRSVREVLRARVAARLLRSLLSRGAGLLVFLTGVYIVLRISGLTQLALTFVGGTGLIGLALGIAFRDIAENYLASIFLSIQRPFESGDLVEITGVTGYVRQLNVRTTVLATLDGNLVQIPNSMVYKNTIRNFTATPNRREEFSVGIGYDDPIDRAQEIALKVLSEHPAVLREPEPWVLADSLGAATVNLRIYFWLNGREHSWLKVRSSVIRLVKRSFQQHGISMPDEAREVVFPKGVPVTVQQTSAAGTEAARGQAAQSTMASRSSPPAPAPAPGTEAVVTKAEGGLASDAGQLEAQARQSKPQGEDLLRRSADPPSAG
ncbi:MAG: mechanosensitive ion channel family protein [Phycisphaerales bacterium]|nr:mechanosensitive ion channel family protein [Phycisphaerales bacterium]